MEKIKSKFFIGFLFSIFATLVNVVFKYHSDFIHLISENIKSIGINFVLFFLIGYVVLGNLLGTKNKS